MAAANVRALPEPVPVAYPSGLPPILFVVIDTEEERAWGVDYSRSTTSVTAMRQVERAQRIFDRFGVRPTYVADYPVVSQPEGYEPLQQIHAEGRASIGAHLHPWVSPPFDEELCRRNTFPGNLAPPIEAEKIRRLADQIEEHFGGRPVAYKAGRYGIGPNTPFILADQGFLIDMSPSPAFDFSAEGGPDFSRSGAEARWFGPERKLLSLPTTGAFVGFLRGFGAGLYRFTSQKALRPLRLNGILSRLGALDRLRLSPEYYQPAEHRQLTQALLQQGVRTFTFSFHSPTLMPGGSAYVKTEAELTRFLDAIERYLDYFLGAFGGISMTPTEFRARLLNEPLTRHVSP